MSSLTIEHISTISHKVEAVGISYSHLQDELIDHLCCEIEKQMLLGKSFEEAFANLWNSIGPKGIQKVQESTLLLIDKKYRIMKRTMRVSGLIALPLMAIGAIFKIMHWPGAGIMLLFGFTTLCMVLLPASLYVMRKESAVKGRTFIYLTALFSGVPLFAGVLFKIQHWPGAGILLLLGFLGVSLLVIPAILASKLRDHSQKKMHVIYVLGAIAISIYLLGELFKIMHYPGGGILLMAGVVLLTSVFLPIYGYKVYKTTTYVKASFIYLCIGIFFFNLFNILLAINVSRDVLNYYAKPYKELLLTSAIVHSNNLTLYEKLNCDSLNRMKSQTDSLIIFAENLKIELIMLADQCNKEEATVKAKRPELIINKADYRLPTLLLCGDNQIGTSGKASILKTRINAFFDSLSQYCKNDKQTLNSIDKLLNTNVPKDLPEENINWEMHQFYHNVLIGAINKLSYLQRNFRMAEWKVLHSIAEKTNIN